MTHEQAFIQQLEHIGYDPIKYLKDARRRARQAGYNPHDLSLSNRPAYKLVMIDNKGKKRYFGRVGYGDYLIYRYLEKIKEAPRGYAKEKQGVFHASHSKIRGKRRDDPFSPNMLALKVNW
jgi:hypothetical protein